MKNLTLVLFFFLISACAGPNPNPGERTVDLAWTSGNYEGAFIIVERHALTGKPWAELRIAIFYENGMGVERNVRKAEEYYLKAITHKADDEWSKGKMIGATGENGFFNQNSDAIIAEYNLAALYYYAVIENDDSVSADLVTAYKHIKNVLNESKGGDVFFCCEFSRGRYFTQEMFLELEQKIKSSMSESDKLKIKDL